MPFYAMALDANISSVSKPPYFLNRKLREKKRLLVRRGNGPCQSGLFS